MEDHAPEKTNASRNHQLQESTGLAPEKIIAWFCVYLIMTGAISTISAILALINWLFPTQILGTMLTVLYLVVPLIMMGIGIASVLPLSEYAYMRHGGRNPAIARESIRHQKRKPEKKDFGVLIGVAGLTVFLRMCPWDLFFFYVWPRLGPVITTFAMVNLLALIVLIYKGKFRKYIRFDT